MTWYVHLHRAATAPGNLLVGAGALALSALTWNPLPLILFGLGDPIWLYKRVSRAITEPGAALAAREDELTWLMTHTPCGRWTREGQLPSYAAIYTRLVDTRDQTARIVAARRDATSVLAQDIAARMDDMLHAYLTMARERLLFHCALAGVFPELPPPRELPPPCDDARFTSLAAATDELRRKVARFEAQIARQPAHEAVYRPIIESLAKHLQELEVRGKHDCQRAAQLEVFPEQFALILQKLGTPQPDFDDVVTDMKLLLEQTDDTVSLAEELRAN